MLDTTDALLFILVVLFIAVLLVFAQVLARASRASVFERTTPPLPSVQRELPADEPDVTLSALRQLTPRERDVALLAARGLTNRQIAGELGLSINTVSNHLKRVYAKLGVRSRAEMSWRLQYLDLHAGAPPDVLD